MAEESDGLLSSIMSSFKDDKGVFQGGGEGRMFGRGRDAIFGASDENYDAIQNTKALEGGGGDARNQMILDKMTSDSRFAKSGDDYDLMTMMEKDESGVSQKRSMNWGDLGLADADKHGLDRSYGSWGQVYGGMKPEHQKSFRDQLQSGYKNRFGDDANEYFAEDWDVAMGGPKTGYLGYQQTKYGRGDRAGRAASSMLDDTLEGGNQSNITDIIRSQHSVTGDEGFVPGEREEMASHNARWSNTGERGFERGFKGAHFGADPRIEEAGY